MSTICVFGDSIAWGAVDEDRGGWVERLKLDLSSKDIDVYNCGVCGNTTLDILKRFDTELIARIGKTNSIVMFAVGINDSKLLYPKKDHAVTKSEFENNILSLYKKAKKFTDKIIFIGITKVDESKTIPVSWNTDKEYKNSIIKEYDDIIKKVCVNNKIKYISLFDLLKSNDLYDGLHPNTSGHEKIFMKVEKFLKSEKMI